MVIFYGVIDESGGFVEDGFGWVIVFFVFEKFGVFFGFGVVMFFISSVVLMISGFFVFCCFFILVIDFGYDFVDFGVWVVFDEVVE